MMAIFLPAGVSMRYDTLWERSQGIVVKLEEGMLYRAREGMDTPFGIVPPGQEVRAGEPVAVIPSSPLVAQHREGGKEIVGYSEGDSKRIVRRSRRGKVRIPHRELHICTVRLL